MEKKEGLKSQISHILKTFVRIQLAMKHSTSLIAIALFIGLQSCFLNDDGEITIARGILTNQITGEGVDGVPIQVRECKRSDCDSLTSALTINGGQYEISFTNKKNRYYKLSVGRNDDYTYSIGKDGYTLQEGKTNTIDLTTIPYKVLKLEIEVSKQEKNFLHLEFRTADSDGNWLGGSILVDTLSQQQMVSEIRYFKVLPQRNYKITKTLCDRSGQQIENYIYSDCVVERMPDFYFPYQDSLTIKVE